MKNLKSKAFLVFCEFGPDLRIPRHERLADKFPSLSASQIDEWIEEFQAAQQIAYDVAIEHRREDWKPKRTLGILADRIPTLNNKAIAKLLNQACYFAMHDGY